MGHNNNNNNNNNNSFLLYAGYPHTHIPGTNHVPMEYIVAAILSLLFMVPLSLVPSSALLCF